MEKSSTDLVLPDAIHSVIIVSWWKAATAALLIGIDARIVSRMVQLGHRRIVATCLTFGAVTLLLGAMHWDELSLVFAGRTRVQPNAADASLTHFDFLLVAAILHACRKANDAAK